MNLSAFSISLTVKDLSASRTFYEKLGFEITDPDGSVCFFGRPLSARPRKDAAPRHNAR